MCCSLVGINIAKHIDTLQRQFRGIHRRFRSELNERRVSVDDVVAELTLLPIECCKEYESLIQQKLPMLEESTRITTLFNRLNPLFTFIDYGLLQHLISNLGSTELKEDVTSYVDAVQEFMHQTTVGDVINHWPGDEESHASFSKLRAKFNDDPKTYTLERLNNFRRKFCSRVRLSEFIFGLISLEPSESFFVTWLIPTVVVTQLSKSIHQIEHSFYESEHILSISINEKQLYPPPSAASIASLTPALSVSARDSKWKQPEVSLAGDLITPTIAPEHAITKKDVQPKSTDDTVDIIVIGWKGATRFAEGIIGPNKNKNLNLWDYTKRMYRPQESDDREGFTKKTIEELQARISKCQHPNLVLVFNNPHGRDKPSFDPTLLYLITIGLSVSDLTRSLGHSIWNNAVVVQPFKPTTSFLTFQGYLKSKSIKPEFEWSDIDPEVIANIPVVPIIFDPRTPALPDHTDWLSPFWDTCLQRMTESAQHTFLQANADRIELATGGRKRKDSRKPLHEQAIIYVPGSNTSKAPVHSAVSNLLGTKVAGPFGTTPVPVKLHRQPDPVDKKKDKCTLS